MFFRHVTAKNVELPVKIYIGRFWGCKLNDQEIFKQIEALYNNPAELLELVKFAHDRIEICQIETGLALPNDYEPEDIVFLVIEKNLEGIRGQGFDSSKGSFKNWLKRQIISEIENKARWHRSMSEFPMPGDREGERCSEEVSENSVERNDAQGDIQPDDPESFLLSEEEAEKFWILLYQCVQGDLELEEIVKSLENGCDFKSQVLADELGWSVDKVNNAKKRFKRRVPRSILRSME